MLGVWVGAQLGSGKTKTCWCLDGNPEGTCFAEEPPVATGYIATTVPESKTCH